MYRSWNQRPQIKIWYLDPLLCSFRALPATHGSAELSPRRFSTAAAKCEYFRQARPCTSGGLRDSESPIYGLRKEYAFNHVRNPCIRYIPRLCRMPYWALFGLIPVASHTGVWIFKISCWGLRFGFCPEARMQLLSGSVPKS